jgi:TRAP transporter 4TM/12TM fusion protein
VPEPGPPVTPWRERAAVTLAFALAIYALYWVVGIVDPQIYRVSFLLIALVLTFLAYPASGIGRRVRVRANQTHAEPALQKPVNTRGHQPHASGIAIDAALIAASLVALAWPIADFDAFVLRAATPLPLDVGLGLVTIVVVLEATRRTTGWILPFTALAFLAYAVFGPALDRIGLALVAHRGYDAERLVGTLYMTLEGIFGVPLDVTATYIVLFTIYGAVLEHSGAGRFFIDWAAAAVGRSGGGAGPGRTVTVAGYLFGSVSGSGVANTVMLGAVAWPMLRRSGYSPDVGGAILAAAGLGAILAPPAMGAAAFLIAEYLNVPYLQVVAMAVVPALLYYLSVFLMIEADSRRLALRPMDIPLPPLGTITRRGWHHFVSLAAIVVLMMRGLTAFRAVFWATMLAIALSFLHRDTALWPRRLARALAAGGRSVLPVAATTATAGIIVGVVTLTGLGLKVAGLIVTLAGSSLLLTALFSALAVWVLGLAVPVTASYIIAAVMIVPALVEVGVAPAAAHMFVFYYAVLSEVSPPTALSPFAAAAITGGNPFRTTMISWKYVTPAFVVPFVFTLDPAGMAVLLQAPVQDILWTSGAAVLGVAAMACGLGGWMRRRANALERVLAVAASGLLFVPRPATAVLGAALLGAVAGVHWVRTR